MSTADFKVVLLGSENVGKTSLMKRYVMDKYQSKPHNNTIGAAFASKKVLSNGREITMGIWDTAGSERYYAMSQLYYRDAKVAIVCFDLTDRATFDRAKLWITEIRNQEENCKIFLCGTKKDIIDEGATQRSVPPEKVLQYSKGIEAQLLETSSKTGENVVELFQIVADTCELPAGKEKQETIKLLSSKGNRGCCSSS